MDKLLSIRVFTAVVEQGGLTAAAQTLPISRASISKHIAQLESELGSRLLYRTTRRISLTEAGRLYYDKCKEILEAVDEADCIVSGLSTQLRGTLRINAPMSFAGRWMGELMARFNKEHPDIHLDITLSDRQVDMIEEGFDLTIRISRPRDSSLVARKLSDCRFLLVGSPEYLSRLGTPSHPNELINHRCLLYSYRPNPNQWVFIHAEDGARSTIKVEGPMITNNGEMICASAVHGLGLAMLPTFIVSDAVSDGDLVPVLQHWSVEASGIYVVYPSRRLLTEKIRQFTEMAVNYFDRTPLWDEKIQGTVSTKLFTGQ